MNSTVIYICYSAAQWKSKQWKKKYIFDLLIIIVLWFVVELTAHWLVFHYFSPSKSSYSFYCHYHRPFYLLLWKIESKTQMLKKIQKIQHLFFFWYKIILCSNFFTYYMGFEVGTKGSSCLSSHRKKIQMFFFALIFVSFFFWSILKRIMNTTKWAIVNPYMKNVNGIIAWW